MPSPTAANAVVDAGAADQWRRDTIALEASGNARRVLHFNAAGAALIPRVVHETVVKHLELEAHVGGYEAEALRSKELTAVYVSAATLIGAKGSDEIALVESATVAWTSAFYSIPFKAGDIVLTSTVEYGANFVALLHLRHRIGIHIELLPNDASGAVCVQGLRDALSRTAGRCRLVSITHVPTNSGLVNPCEQIGEAVAQFNRERAMLPASNRGPKVLYLMDACQSVGQMPVHVERLRCDFLSATSRKYLRGPRGCGFLYVRGSVLPTLHPPTIDHFSAKWVAENDYTLVPSAKRFEKWESSPALRLGMGAAIDYALKTGIERIWVRVRMLAAHLRDALSSCRVAPTIVTVHDIGAVQCGIVTFTVQGWLAAELKRALEAVAESRNQRINTTLSTVATSRIDLQRRGLEAGVNRASVHYYNTINEIDDFVDALRSATRDGASSRRAGAKL
jgi:cysteine desulfurase/selenocysteine lyase